MDDIERDSALQQRGGRLRVLYIIVSYRVFLLQVGGPALMTKKGSDLHS